MTPESTSTAAPRRRATSAPTFADYTQLRIAVHNIAARRPRDSKKAETFELQRKDAQRALSAARRRAARRDLDLIGTGGPVDPALYSQVETALRTIATRRPRNTAKARTFELCRSEARTLLRTLAV